MFTDFVKIILMIGLLCGCLQNADDKQYKTRSKAQLVHVAVVSKQILRVKQTVSGSLNAINKVAIFNQETGQIKQLPYYPGDSVNKNDILVYLDDATIRSSLDKAIANYQQTKSNLRRLTQLVSKNLASEDEVSRARTAVELARAEQSLQKNRLSHTLIKAPFSGVISERLREAGDVVALHSHILTLIDITRLNVKIQISELLISKLTNKDTVSISIDALGNNSYTGTISRIYPTINSNTRKGTIEVELDKIPTAAKPGQLSRVTFITQPEKTRVVDYAAIRYDSDGEYVLLINDQAIVEQTRIQTGIQVDNKIEIISGLVEHDRVVIKGFNGLRSGKKVEISKPNTTTTTVDNKIN